MCELTGITWNHTRGYLPMVATAQRFCELRSTISITWHKRSLQQFADAHLSDLASRFDLLVIDHPSIGEAVHQDLLLPLDLLERANAQPPATGVELLALARRGLVTVPAIAIDSLMNFFMLANALGAEPFCHPDEVTPQGEGVRALELLRELVQLSAEGSLERNPIRTWQLLADSETVAYCPFAYGYSNYSRPGYAANP